MTNASETSPIDCNSHCFTEFVLLALHFHFVWEVFTFIYLCWKIKRMYRKQGTHTHARVRAHSNKNESISFCFSSILWVFWHIHFRFFFSRIWTTSKQYKTHTLTRTSAQEAIKMNSLSIKQDLFGFVVCLFAVLQAVSFRFYLFIVHFYCIYELYALQWWFDGWFDGWSKQSIRASIGWLIRLKEYLNAHRRSFIWATNFRTKLLIGSFRSCALLNQHRSIWRRTKKHACTIIKTNEGKSSTSASHD